MNGQFLLKRKILIVLIVKKKNEIILPKNYQVLETFLASRPCTKKCDEAEKSSKKEKLGELYYLKCDERTRVPHPSVLTTKCKNCGCVLEIEMIEGIDSTQILELNPVVRLYNWFGEITAKKIVVDMQRGSCHSVFLNHYRLKRFGEIFFCFILILSLVSFRFLIFNIMIYTLLFSLVSAFILASK